MAAAAPAPLPPPLRPLPPGVYFNPTAEECVRDYLRPWAASSGALPPAATDRVVCGVDLYSDSPGALLLGRAPGFSRGSHHKWLVLSACAKAAAGGRARRGVATGGWWQSEQKPKAVVAAGDGEDEGEGGEEEPRGGRRRSFGFYVDGGGGGGNGDDPSGGRRKKRAIKTPWLMEEFTALDLPHVVFCRIYLTPRLDKGRENREKKRQILGDHMVAFDRHGNTKPVRVVVSPELFDAVAAQRFPAPPPRLLGHPQQAQPPPPPPRLLGHPQQAQPPPPPPHVLGHPQAQPWAPPLLRFLGHQQHGKKAVLGDHHGLLGDHHGRAMLPRAVPAHHDGHQAVLPWGVPAHHHHGHAVTSAAAAPHPQRFLGYQQGRQIAVQQLEKKPRLAYGGSDGATSSCVIQIHDDNQRSAAEPVAPTPPKQEITGTTATAGSAEAEHTAVELAGDPGKAGAAEPMLDLGIYVNLVDIEPFCDGVPDFLMQGEFKPQYDDDDVPPPLLGFDEFPLMDFLTSDSV